MEEPEQRTSRKKRFRPVDPYVRKGGADAKYDGGESDEDEYKASIAVLQKKAARIMKKKKDTTKEDKQETHDSRIQMPMNPSSIASLLESDSEEEGKAGPAIGTVDQKKQIFESDLLENLQLILGDLLPKLENRDILTDEAYNVLKLQVISILCYLSCSCVATYAEFMSVPNFPWSDIVQMLSESLVCVDKSKSLLVPENVDDSSEIKDDTVEVESVGDDSVEEDSAEDDAAEIESAEEAQSEESD